MPDRGVDNSIAYFYKKEIMKTWRNELARTSFFIG